jgi:hypothetical protein
MTLLIIQIYFSRHYYTDADKTRIKIKSKITYITSGNHVFQLSGG